MSSIRPMKARSKLRSSVAVSASWSLPPRKHDSDQTQHTLVFCYNYGTMPTTSLTPPSFMRKETTWDGKPTSVPSRQAPALALMLERTSRISERPHTLKRPRQTVRGRLHALAPCRVGLQGSSTALGSASPTPWRRSRPGGGTQTLQSAALRGSLLRP
jgi:hypothetical protein